jgi:DNA-binding Xre family transcriptional regulator
VTDAERALRRGRTPGRARKPSPCGRRRAERASRGSSLDEFLEEEGILEEATAKAAKKALAWQFAQAMKEQNITKAALARRMKTSRAQLDRLLDPENQSVTLKTLVRAAEILGMRVQIELLDA